MDTSVGQKRGFIIFFILLVIGITVSLLSPTEIMLGDIAKLVYLHGALVWVGLILFGITGVIGVVQLTFRNTKSRSYLPAFEETATIFWLISTALGFAVAYLAWGGIVWIEPRVTMTIIISILVLVTYYLSTEYSNQTRNSILVVIQILVITGLIVGTGRVFHPKNPIVQSELSIQLVFILLVTVFLASALQIVKLRLPSKIS